MLTRAVSGILGRWPAVLGGHVGSGEPLKSLPHFSKEPETETASPPATDRR